MKNSFFYVLLLLFMKGVFDEEIQEQRNVDVTLSVMEGVTVTLESAVTEIQGEMVLWIFQKDTPIAKMNESGAIFLYDGDNGMFRGKLQMNNQTGSLTISDIRTEHSGLYLLEVHGLVVTSRKFQVTVTPLPVPVISKNSSLSSSSSKCVLLCSVLNVRDVSLSWYKGNSLLSSISVSDLNIRLSLPLEVKHKDTNTYSCVVNNTNTNQTQHLNITHVCGFIPLASGKQSIYPWLAVCVVALLAIIVAVVGVCYFKSSEAGQRDQPTEYELNPLKNGQTSNQEADLQSTLIPEETDDQATSGQISVDVVDEQNNVTCQTSNQKADLQSTRNPEETDDQATGGWFCMNKDSVKNIKKIEGESITLQSGVAVTEEDEICWKFAKHKVFGQTIQFEIIAKWTKTDGEKLLGNRFKDRLQLENLTGSLTITKLNTKDTGHYKLLIPRKISKTFNVDVNAKELIIKRRHTTDNKIMKVTTV
ncbi:uncharacterized protein [Misgurnus anguillicaudatus]|uniref:uncharacterized protein n=1 Tax=Misgurnus anguillicaudatus TaxID=75329 RepID=UPI003CCF6D23